MFGLVLCGGLSSRMGIDKAELVYANGKPQFEVCFALLETICSSVFISCRREQRSKFSKYPCIVDSVVGKGPGVGLLSAFQKFPNESWLVLACDMPWVDLNCIETLISQRAPSLGATVFQSPSVSELIHPANDRSIKGGIIEPLCAIWEPSGLRALDSAFQAGKYSLQSVLKEIPCRILNAPSAQALVSVNDRSTYLSVVKSE